MTTMDLLATAWTAAAAALPPSPWRATAAVLVLGALAYVLTAAVQRLLLKPLRLVRYLRRQGVRGPRFTPLVGDMPVMRPLHGRPDGYFMVSVHFQRMFGAVSYGFLGPDIRLRLHRPDLVREVLVSKAGAFHKPWITRSMLEPLLGANSLLLSEGALHRRHRSMISPAFHFIHLKGMTALMTDAAAACVERWVPRGATPAAPVEVDAHVAISALTLDIIGRAAFGSPPAAEGGGGGGNGSAPAAGDVYALLAALLTAAADTVLSLRIFIPGYAHLPTPGNRATAANIASLRGVLQGVVAQRRALRDARARSGSGGGGADGASAASPDPLRYGQLLVDLLLDAREGAGDASGAKAAGAPPTGSRAGGGGAGGTGFTDGEVLDEAMTFLAAGHETTAQALSWAMLLLAQHPQWKARARRQVLEVVGADRPPAYDDLASLPLLTAILNECLRLYPPVPLITREAVEDVVLEGDEAVRSQYEAAAADGGGGAGPRDVAMRAGMGVVVPIAALNRDPVQWGPTADEFDPGRFEGGGSAVAGGGAGAAARTHPMSFLPFSAGPRSCVGANFALLEARLILAVLLQRADWEVSPAYVHHPVSIITLRPKFGMPLRLWRLPPAAAAAPADRPA